MSPVRRFWPVLAIATGGLLVYFELVHSGGDVGGDSIFWIVVSGLIVVLGLIDLIQKARGTDESAGRRKMPDD